MTRQVLVDAELLERLTYAASDLADDRGRQWCGGCGEFNGQHLADCPVPALRNALAQPQAEADAGQVLVNRQALTMILACLQEGADDPHWEQVYPSGCLFSAVNELTLNLEGESDAIERQTLAEIAEEYRAALAQAPASAEGGAE